MASNSGVFRVVPILGLAAHLGRGLQHPSRELAYTLTTGMTTVDRQGHERELLDEYRRELVAAGGPHLDREELWERYRMAALYAYVAPLITAGMGGMQADSIALEGVRRGVVALEDLDTVALLEKSLAS